MTTTSVLKQFTELLVSSGLVTERQLQQALAAHRQQGGSLTQILVRQGALEEREWLSLLAEKLGIPPLNLAKFKVDPAVAKLIPERLARQYRLIGISKLGHRLVVAMADPLNVFAMDDIRALTHHDLDPVLSSENDILRAIDGCYQSDKGRISELVEELDRSREGLSLPTAGPVDLKDTIAASREAPIVRMVDLIIQEGLKRRASDVHLEPGEHLLSVRYRVDGQLQEAFTVPKAQQNAILVRLKILAGLNITEWRLPQDGRFKLQHDKREIDFRVSVLPIFHGGKVVLRVLDRTALKLGLDQLGCSPEPMQQLTQAVANPYGMLLVTGPTGSGKTTTLYAVLNQLNLPERNIMTIEDPVEYQLDGITQLQVNPEIGLTFASGLRALLRQSPDIIMVGEIRDGETADIATKASLTGQLVLSTLHTNDAAGAITRLVDMGVEPFLVASGVVLIAAQRLARRLCTHCREAVQPSAELKAQLQLADGQTIYRAKGCEACQGSGYRGRLALLEVLTINDTIRDMIIQQATSLAIRTYAMQHGLTLLREDGLRRVREGATSYEEVLRVTVEE